MNFFDNLSNVLVYKTVLTSSYIVLCLTSWELVSGTKDSCASTIHGVLPGTNMHISPRCYINVMSINTFEAYELKRPGYWLITVS